MNENEPSTWGQIRWLGGFHTGRGAGDPMRWRALLPPPRTPRQLSAAGHERERHGTVSTPSVRGCQLWKMVTMADICEALWVFSLALPCNNPWDGKAGEKQPSVTDEETKTWRGSEICPQPPRLGGWGWRQGGASCLQCSHHKASLKPTVRSSVSKCWPTNCAGPIAGLDAGGGTHKSMTREPWPPRAQSKLWHFVQAPEQVGQPLSTRAMERRGSPAGCRMLQERGRAWAGPAGRAVLESLGRWRWGSGSGWVWVGRGGVRRDRPSRGQGEENRMERVSRWQPLALSKEVKPML